MNTRTKRSMLAVTVLMTVLQLASCNKADQSNATASSASAPVANKKPGRLPSRTHTMGYFWDASYGGAVAVILKDGTIASRTFALGYTENREVDKDGNPKMTVKVGELVKMPDVSDALRIAPNSGLFVRSDKSWWIVDRGSNPPVKINLPLLTPDIADFQLGLPSGGIGSVFWGLTSEGRVHMFCPGFEKNRKGALLDRIVSLCAMNKGDVGGRNALMLRADGTVWIDGEGNDGKKALSELGLGGMVTATGLGSAKQIPGLKGAKEISFWSRLEYAHDTGIALIEDGSVVSWGVPVTPDAYSAKGNDLSNDGSPFPATPELQQGILTVKCKKVSTGQFAAGAIDADGNVWQWGYGQGAAQVAGIKDAVDILFCAYGPGANLALCNDGSVWAWAPSLPAQQVFTNVKIPD